MTSVGANLDLEKVAALLPEARNEMHRYICAPETDPRRESIGELEMACQCLPSPTVQHTLHPVESLRAREVPLTFEQLDQLPWKTTIKKKFAGQKKGRRCPSQGNFADGVNI